MTPVHFSGLCGAVTQDLMHIRRDGLTQKSLDRSKRLRYLYESAEQLDDDLRYFIGRDNRLDHLKPVFAYPSELTNQDLTARRSAMSRRLFGMSSRNLIRHENEEIPRLAELLALTRITADIAAKLKEDEPDYDLADFRLPDAPSFVQERRRTSQLATVAEVRDQIRRVYGASPDVLRSAATNTELRSTSAQDDQPANQSRSTENPVTLSSGTLDHLSAREALELQRDLAQRLSDVLQKQSEYEEKIEQYQQASAGLDRIVEQIQEQISTLQSRRYSAKPATPPAPTPAQT